MKRILFCAGILALAASCTQDEFETSAVNEAQSRGISFETVAPEVPQTRGGLEYDGKAHNYFWYAEKDRINVWSTNTKSLAGDINTPNDSHNWDDTKYAEYKATMSNAGGEFTGSDDANTLDFKYTPDQYDGMNAANLAKYQAKFFAVYPTTATLEISRDAESNDELFTISSLPALNDQNQKEFTGQDVSSKLMMYGINKGVRPQNNYDAVGEKLGLSMIRPFTAVIFRSANGNDYYENYFGKLQSIKLEMLGYDANENGDYSDNGDIVPSIIDYGTDAKYVYNNTDDEKSGLVGNNDKAIEPKWDKTTDPSNPKVAVDNLTNAATEITLQFNGGAGLEWKDGEAAYMAVSSVDRSKYTNGKAESMRATWTFDRITLTMPGELPATSNNWPAVKNANQFMTGQVLDINAFDYLVTNETSAGDDRTLIVNGGATEGFTFSDIFVKNNGTTDYTQVEWAAGDAPVTEFETIIVNNVTLTNEELALLKTFTNLKEIKLGENTTIPTGTFTAANGDLKVIDFPKVDVIGNNAFHSSINLSEVYLPSYAFGDETIALQILKAGSLTKLDMSGVANMNVGFPSTGFTLQNYTLLSEVTVQDGVNLGATAFAGCTSLKTIKGGAVNVAGPSVFNNCSALTSITVVGTEIPASAFEGCSRLATIKQKGAAANTAYAPTKVETRGFKGCAALTTMNLRNLTEIGQEAFMNCSKLYGEVVDKTKHVIYVGGEVINESAFAGCNAIQHIEFLNATSIGADILKVNGATLKQVQFDQIISMNPATGSSNFTGDEFGATPENVDLFINSNQPTRDYTSNTLNLKNEPITFNAVRYAQGEL